MEAVLAELRPCPLLPFVVATPLIWASFRVGVLLFESSFVFGAVGRARTRRLSGRDTDFSRALRAAAGGDLHPDPNRVRAVRRLAGSRHTGNSPYAMAWRLCATRAVMGVDVWGIAQLVEQLM
jgi:hypothetical protein